MAKFIKGESGNPEGKPKGAKNKMNTIIKEAVINLLEANIEQINEDLQAVDARDRLNFWIKLLEYSLPKLARTESGINLNNLSDEQINDMINKILNRE